MNIKTSGFLLFPLLLILCSFLTSCLNNKDKANLTVINCDLNTTSCSFKNQKQEFQLTISPRPIVLNQLLDIKITSNNPIDPNQKVYIDFRAKQMDMGYNRPVFIPENQFSLATQTVLPACYSQKMNWILTLTMEENNKKKIFQFNLQTLH